MTVTRTLRLDSDLDRAIRKLADEKGETVNAVASRALRRLVEWDALAEKLGMVMITPEVLVKLMETHTVRQARNLGEWVAKELWGPYVRYHYMTLDLDSVRSSLELHARYAARFEFDTSTDGGKAYWLFRHSMGLKWSAFYEGVAIELLVGLLGVKPQSSITDELCAVEFEVPTRQRV